MSEEEKRQETPDNIFWKIARHFSETEKRNPHLAKQLLPMILGLMGDKTVSPDMLQKYEPYINVGFALLGDWLQQNGYGGFSINLSMGDGLKKAAAPLFVKLPADKNELLSKSGIDQSLWPTANQEISVFSQTIREGLEVGFTPRIIAATLLYYNTTDKPTDGYTSPTLRGLIDKGTAGKMPQVNQILHNWIWGQR